MGNSKSSSSGDPSLLSYSQNIEENEYIPTKPSKIKHHHSSLDKLHSLSIKEDSSPPLVVVMRSKPRSQTVLSTVGSSTETYEARRKTFMESLSQSVDKVTSSDSLTRRITSVAPSDGALDVSVDCTVRVQFDKDVKTVNANKLFEVHCLSVKTKQNLVKGRSSYDPRHRRAEFIPTNTLYPNTKYLVKMLGSSITTTECSHGHNISNMETKFETGYPTPRTIRIKLRGDEKQSKSEIVHITNSYEPYNSLVAWNARKWGISGEFITAINVEDDEGQLQAVKDDHDVLRLQDNQIIYVDIKD